ncbi:esterase, PHB depolymerase family [Saccharopolyspora kobensis]|uniref:Esterase, PHB depolymerase family n=1 Tax=Saccharopolyspora kobensis TaxID=146035 RepID=A0A1H6BGP3_9PSEU|nr:PHB depolymerase family esterase [Saccharopolyspora kobensis]SEG59928.1 esterase, PHB depolymerase family [Saccharopolyspora kobensis]SFE89418.1 esterase, PHB depolymerase family [Saccharopolyspora kobensis]
MRVFSLVLAVLLATVVAAPADSAAELREVTGFGGNPGALRMFEYVPDGLPEGRPVVVAMHGCTQDAAGYGTGAGWVELADSARFTLVLPQQEQANNANRCFNWFQPGDTARGSGEAESIAQMVRRAIADTGADPARVYVTGLSAGGAMTAALLAAYPDVFAGGGVVAGVPHGCASSMIDAFTCMNPGKDKTPEQWGDAVRGAGSHQGPWPTLSIWHGTADYTVAPANQRELVEQWTNVHGIPATPTSTDTIAGYPHESYADSSGRTLVETISITGMGHGQPIDPGSADGQCGQAGSYLLDVDVCAAWHLSRSWGLPAGVR